MLCLSVWLTVGMLLSFQRVLLFERWIRGRVCFGFYELHLLQLLNVEWYWFVYVLRLSLCVCVSVCLYVRCSVLYDNMHNRTHPLGMLYSELYDFLNWYARFPCAQKIKNITFVCVFALIAWKLAPAGSGWTVTRPFGTPALSVPQTWAPSTHKYICLSFLSSFFVLCSVCVVRSVL